jgi:Tol biopolymer transport system component
MISSTTSAMDNAEASIWPWLQPDPAGPFEDVLQLWRAFDYLWRQQGGGKPSWSPDGKKILYFNNNPEKGRSWLEIFVTDAAGGNTVMITNDYITSEDPCWSADGSKIYFIRQTDKLLEKASLFEIDFKGRNLRKLTSVSALDRHPSPSPDGFRIAFQSNRDGNNEIYVTRVSN